ncbi:urease accessory protein UreF [Jannaschia ovalis]|uniref:Urease accessory protein UreF n=1 Tax=Jannaschia ovalis TaxID=3038773 RepID=A0ABY8LF90_9RHOB|nr:urease accessory UreF family protein [Jannaschia sp. GRR-S6-38]WGH79975.1 urease accessory UreF family protein [Jannaschia sp. GRR-S6-38]
MPTDPRLLTLAQWLSPAYPLGSFAFSHGLEAAVAEGWVVADTLQGWLDDTLRHGAGRSDAILLRLAHDAEGAALARLDVEARAFAGGAERLAESARQGAAFARTTAAIWGFDLPPMLLPVAVGRATRLAALDPDDACALSLQAFAANLVACAQRLLPLGQTEGQRILAALAPVVTEIAGASRDATLDDLATTAFLSEIAAMRHEIQAPRLFQT